MRRLLLGLGAVGLLVGMAVSLLVRPMPRRPGAGPMPRRPGVGITRENFAKIEKGMTEAEVESILRCQPGDYTGGTRRVLWGIPAGGSFLIPDLNKPVRPEDFPEAFVWVAYEFAVVVCMSPGEAKVLFAYTLPVEPVSSIAPRPPPPPAHLVTVCPSGRLDHFVSFRLKSFHSVKKEQSPDERRMKLNANETPPTCTHCPRGLCVTRTPVGAA
jgi:hypothetical protein